MRRITRSLTIAAIITLASLIAFIPNATARGAGAKGGKPSGGGSSSMSLVLLDSTDGVPHWGQRVRFNVSTTATSEPHVSVSCSQNGTTVYTAQTGYYDSYAWPWTQTFTLSSGVWTGGDADCSARLYSASNSGSTTTLASMSFHAFA